MVWAHVREIQGEVDAAKEEVTKQNLRIER